MEWNIGSFHSAQVTIRGAGSEAKVISMCLYEKLIDDAKRAFYDLRCTAHNYSWRDGVATTHHNIWRWFDDSRTDTDRQIYTRLSPFKKRNWGPQWHYFSYLWWIAQKSLLYSISMHILILEQIHRNALWQRIERGIKFENGRNFMTLQGRWDQQVRIENHVKVEKEDVEQRVYDCREGVTMDAKQNPHHNSVIAFVIWFQLCGMSSWITQSLLSIALN